MKVFLSHASADKDIVRKFQIYLPKHVHVWLDENELGLGQRFPEKLEKAVMEECDFVIVFISQVALDSDWVRQEIDWAEKRQYELGREFLFPVLLEDIWEDAQEKIPAMRDRLYLQCWDHSDEGARISTDRLSQALFAFVSRYFGTTKVTPAGHFLDQLKEDLVTYKEVSYQLCATLGDSIAVLTENEDARNLFAKAVDDYNTFTSEFMRRISDIPAKVRKYWGNNIADETAVLLSAIENEAYRGQVFVLNEIREDLILCSDPEVYAQQDITVLDDKKDTLLGEANLVIRRISQESTALINKIEKEL